MAKTQITGFTPNKIPAKSGAYIAADSIDRFDPAPKYVEGSDLRTKRSGGGSQGFDAKTK